MVWTEGFTVQDLGFSQASTTRVMTCSVCTGTSGGVRVLGLGFRVQGLELRIKG